MVQYKNKIHTKSKRKKRTNEEEEESTTTPNYIPMSLETIHIDVSIENNGRMFILFDYSILPETVVFFLFFSLHCLPPPPPSHSLTSASLFKV